MTTDTPTLGVCPRCGSSIPEHRVLITYKRDDQPAAYAACPECREPVRPAE